MTSEQGAEWLAALNEITAAKVQHLFRNQAVLPNEQITIHLSIPQDATIVPASKKEGYMMGLVTKEDFANTLRCLQAEVNEIKSEQRERAKVAMGL